VGAQNRPFIFRHLRSCLSLQAGGAEALLPWINELVARVQADLGSQPEMRVEVDVQEGGVHTQGLLWPMLAASADTALARAARFIASLPPRQPPMSVSTAAAAAAPAAGG
jgi:hypothetical protein